MFLTGAGAGCLALLFVIVARSYGQLSVARVFLALVLASFGFLFHPLAEGPVQLITFALQSCVPALFWLLCQLAFASRPRLVSVWSAMALYSVLAPNLTRFASSFAALGDTASFLGWSLGQYFEYAIIIQGLWTVISHWSDDLVNPRRYLRGVVVLSVGVSVSLAAVSLNFGYEVDMMRPILVIIPSLITAFFMMEGQKTAAEFRPETYGNPTALPAAPFASDKRETVTSAQLTDDIARVTDAMAAGFYRTENLTLKMLARHTRLPEYKTRAAINQGLGYRNFNDYLNHLRIQEATERLTHEPQTPIQNISLDIGYRSLSSFNRAFRDIVGVTPTQFRHEHSTDSVAKPSDQNLQFDESVSLPKTS